MPEIVPIDLAPAYLRPSLRTRARGLLTRIVRPHPTRDGSVHLLDREGDVWVPRGEGWMLRIRTRDGRLVDSNHALPYEWVARNYGPMLRLPGDVR